MGLRSSVVVCVTSFLLGQFHFFYNALLLIPLSPSKGALFTHWIADSLTLWKSPVTDEHLWTAATYYSILAKCPPEILYFLAAIVILGGLTILWSLRDGEAGNIMFDGGSICGIYFILSECLAHQFCLVLFGTTIVMYLHSVLPSRFLALWCYISRSTNRIPLPLQASLRNSLLCLPINSKIPFHDHFGLQLLNSHRIT